MSKLWSIMALMVVVFGVLTFVVADQTWFWAKPMTLPADYSAHGKTIDNLYYFILALTGVVFVATEGALFYFMWKYDAKNNTEPVKYSHGSHTLEIVWTIIPAVTLLFIALYQFNSWSDVKIRKPDIDPTVEVTARQWEWRIRYPGEDGKLGTPDDVFDVNELLVPANSEVLVSLKIARHPAQLFHSQSAHQAGCRAGYEDSGLVPRTARERRESVVVRDRLRRTLRGKTLRHERKSHRAEPGRLPQGDS
ncbi:MAG: cytochrome c oxidase subunit II transmembrane domain-containing protein [Pirellulales bacterium]